MIKTSMASFTRREFIKKASLSTLPFLMYCNTLKKQPNVVYVFADQWRASDTGYAGNKQVHTPNLDNLASKSLVLTNAVSGCPVCSPYRASLMTGQYWLTHGVFYNDKPLKPRGVTLANAFKQAGYATGYIGKWHLMGVSEDLPYPQNRQAPVPKDKRMGFDFWKTRECTHDYNHSFYYDENDVKHTWQGYDAIAQTQLASEYIETHADKGPFFLMLSWGPPHAPYETAPQKYRDMFDPKEIKLRPNVPKELEETAKAEIAGYYAHMAALDDCIADLLGTIEKGGIEKHTIFVFTSDHGDMLRSHGMTKKQKPWDESIKVPFVLRYPQLHGKKGQVLEVPFNTPDIMPTLLGLCDIQIPKAVEGSDFSAIFAGAPAPEEAVALLSCPVPFHQWGYSKGGREYRGLRTRRYTYVKDLNGPWLLYDNTLDPYQMNNLVDHPSYQSIKAKLDERLQRKLLDTRDAFLPGQEYMKKWGYGWDGSDAPD